MAVRLDVVKNNSSRNSSINSRASSYTVSELIAVAEAELGYKEKKTNSNLDNKTANAGSENWTKYARDLNLAGYYNGNKNSYAWCDMFVDWCFLKLVKDKTGKDWKECRKTAEELICQENTQCGAGCVYSLQYYKSHKRHGTTPVKGAQIFFIDDGIVSHTGIVVNYDANKVYTIEGNTSNCVKRKEYSRNSSRIVGYGYPRLSGITVTDNGSSYNTPEEYIPIIRVGDVVSIDSNAVSQDGHVVQNYHVSKTWIVSESKDSRKYAKLGRCSTDSSLVLNKSYLKSNLTVHKATGSVSESSNSGTMTTEERIWNFLYREFKNAYGVAGLMGNLYAESGLRSNNLQNSYAKKLTGKEEDEADKWYTTNVDNGTYTNFIHDSAGYGLAQWTYHSRKKNLLEFANARGSSIGDLDMQLEFLCKELKNYKSVYKNVVNATSIKQASDSVLHDFEAPADQSEAVENRRCSYGQNIYDRCVGSCTHNTTSKVGVVDASCTEDGYTGDTVCKDCKQTVRYGDVIPCSGHTFNSSGVCTVCGYSESVNEDPTDPSLVTKEDLEKLLKLLYSMLER